MDLSIIELNTNKKVWQVRGSYDRLEEINNRLNVGKIIREPDLINSTGVKLILNKDDLLIIDEELNKKEAIESLNQEEEIEKYADENNYPINFEIHEEIREMYEKLFSDSNSFLFYALLRSLKIYTSTNPDYSEYLFSY